MGKGISKFLDIAKTLSETGQNQFKLDIRPEPIKEDPDAQSAFSSVANTLRAVSCVPVKIPAFRSPCFSKRLKSPRHESLAQSEGAEMSGTQCLCLPGSHSRAPASVAPKPHLRRPSI